MILELSDVTKTYPGEHGPVSILGGVSLSVAPSETVALTGDSGSGKSTLLHIAAGLETSDSGRVTVCGQALGEIGDAPRAALRRERIGIVFQQFNLIPSLDVATNIAFQARLAGRHDPARIQALIETLGLAEQAHAYPETLSGGQQQRVAIGRAVAANPALILADEPTGNLDETTGDAVIDLMLRLVADTGAALLMVTHSARIAARADRSLHLSHGRLAP